jgi:hypothetical protein
MSTSDKRPEPSAAGSLLAQPLRMPSPGRAAAYVGLLLAGAVVGVAGALVQGAFFPGGLLLALAGAAGLFLGGARLTGSRAGAAVPVAGWLVAVVRLTEPAALPVPARRHGGRYDLRHPRKRPRPLSDAVRVGSDVPFRPAVPGGTRKGYALGRGLPLGSGQYRGARRRQARREVVTGGGANRENLP